MPASVFDAVEIAAPVLPGADERGSVLRRRDGLQVGSGGRHFFLITGERAGQGAAVGIGDHGAAEEPPAVTGEGGGSDENLVQVGLYEQPGHLIWPVPAARRPLV